MSICVPVYNGAGYLRQCLDSALAQTFTNFEVLVVDDCSKDSSLHIASEYARQDPRVRVIANKRNRGLCRNWNRCVELAGGQWIKFLPQDDFMTPTCLEAMLGADPTHSSLIVACDRETRYEPGTSMEFRTTYEAAVTKHNLHVHFPGVASIDARAFADHLVDYPTDNCVGEPTAMLIHRDAFRRYGYFDTRLIQLPDWEFAARVAVNAGLFHVPAALVTFRVHPSSTTSLNSQIRRYRKDLIDPLLMLLRIVGESAFGPVRAAAAARRPPVNLKMRLGSLAEQAGVVAADYQARPEWVRLVAAHPTLFHVLSRGLKFKLFAEVMPRPLSKVVREAARGVGLATRRWRHRR